MLEGSELSPAGRPFDSLRSLAPSLERLFAGLLVVTILAIAAGSAGNSSVKSGASGLRWVALAALGATAVGLAWSCATEAAVTALERRGAALAAALVGLCFLSAAWSVDPKLTVERAVTVAVVIATSAATAFSAARRPGLVPLVLSAVLVAIAALLVASVLWYAVDPSGALQRSVIRFRGVEENPDTLPLIAAYGLPLAAWRFTSSGRLAERIACATCFAVILLLIGASGSRGGLLAGLVALLVYVWVEAGVGKRALVLAAGAVVVCAATVAVTPLVSHSPGATPASPSAPTPSAAAGPGSSSQPGASGRSGRPSTPGTGPSRSINPGRFQDEVGAEAYYTTHSSPHGFFTSSGRIEAWRGAIGQADQRPLLGYGFGTEDRVFIDRYAAFEGDRAENSLIGFYLQLGAVGLITLGMLVGWAVLRGIRTIRRVPASRRPALAPVAAIVAAGGAEMLVQSYVTSAGDIAMLTFWLCLGLFATSSEWVRA